MAAVTKGTPYKTHVIPEDTGLYKVKQTDASAKKASELLQTDLEKHHVFFNTDGFHNHIPHHILALYGTGAGPGSLQKGFDHNASYQRSVLPTHDRVIEDLQTWEHASRYLGKEQYYPDFLRFFQREIDARGDDGWESVIAKYLLSGNNNDDMLVRLFSGFLHPLIQLMYGMEWRQPAIVAEGLAQAAVHGNDIGGFLLESERRARYRQHQKGEEKMPPVVSLLEAVRADAALASAASMEDANKVRDGVLVRAREEMIDIASRVRVSPDELEERTAEMFDACVYMAAAAAVVQYPRKHPKFDFFLIHHVNASPIFLTINAQPWIPRETKARLLEWKIRMDLIQYAGRAVPPLSVDKIASYQLRAGAGTGTTEGQTTTAPIDIIRCLHNFPDDGHAIKLGRAALICRDLTARYYRDQDQQAQKEQKSWVRIWDDDLWTKVYHLIVDSVEAPGPNWVRTCGLDEAWKDVPDRAEVKL